MAKRAKAARAKARRASAKRAKAKRAKGGRAPAGRARPAAAAKPEAPARPGRIAVMQIPHEVLTGTPDGSGPVQASGLLAMHVRYFQQLTEYDPSLSRFEMQRRAKAMIKDAIGKMLEQGVVDSLADGAWEQYEKLVRRGSRDMAVAMLRSPFGTLASVARALVLRFKRRKAERP